MQGALSLVLHAHLPFVRHPEMPAYVEEDWLYEAISETYLPLLLMFGRLERDAIPFSLTMSMTPPLCEMLADPLLQERYRARLSGLISLSAARAEQLAGTPFHDGAAHAHQTFLDVSALYDALGGDVVGAFAEYQRKGHLEIITCAATHGLMPLMLTDEARVAQLRVATQTHLHHFGVLPRGIWLPECAYAPGLEALLKDAGIAFFFMQNHGLLNATPAPRFGTTRPCWTPSGVAAFARDPECSEKVWSAELGYPGDSLYREFYRDAGWDMDWDTVQQHLGPGLRRGVGLKLHRVTGDVSLDDKEPYVPAWAAERARDHARDFVENRVAQVTHLRQTQGFAPHLLAPFDAELFGHWWFEGPLFLEHVFREAHKQHALVLTTPPRYLESEPVHEVVQPAISSWGDGGQFKVWCNSGNSWMLRHLHVAEERMVELAKRFDAVTYHDNGGLTLRALNQAGRELLLAQSSDWAFIVTMDTAVDYAIKRTCDHLDRFLTLYEQLLAGAVDKDALEAMEWRDNPFAQLDFRAWHPRHVRHRGAGSAVVALSSDPHDDG